MQSAGDGPYARLVAAQREVSEQERRETERARDEANERRRVIRRLPKVF